MTPDEMQLETLRLIFEMLQKIHDKVCDIAPDPVAVVGIEDFFNSYGDLLPAPKIEDLGSEDPAAAAPGIALAGDIYSAFVTALAEYANTGVGLEWEEPPPPEP